jgi:general stress protein YciG
MSGTVKGGHKAAITNKMRYGENFYRTIGRMGGTTAGKPKGFAVSSETARAAGRKGGMASRRRKPATV